MAWTTTARTITSTFVITTPATSFAYGGGVDYQLSRSVWLRGDYEYQSWPDFHTIAKRNMPIHPEGFTIGAIYHFGSHSTYR